MFRGNAGSRETRYSTQRHMREEEKGVEAVWTVPLRWYWMAACMLRVTLHPRMKMKITGGKK